MANIKMGEAETKLADINNGFDGIPIVDDFSWTH